MAVYGMNDNARILDKIWSYANEKIVPERYSTLFQRSPLLTYLAAKNKSDNRLGRPGTLGLIGGSGNFNQVDIMREAEMSVQIRLHAQKTDHHKWLAERDNMPSTGSDSQDQNNISASFRYAHLAVPIKIWNHTRRFSRGSAKIADAVREGVDEAMEVASDIITEALWRGNPTDQSKNLWDQPLGVLQALDTDNTYGNVNRGTYTFWAGKRVTASKTAALSLIDEANLVQGTTNKGPGVDLCITSNAIFYALKQQAITQGNVIVSSTMPGTEKIGSKFECIQYGRTMIVSDPFLTGNWSSYDSDVTDATKLMVMFNTDDWVFSTHPEGNWTIDPFTDQSRNEGGSDAYTSVLHVMPRLRCNKPERSIVYTNVGVGS